MRTTKELEDYAERFAAAEDSPFKAPDELDLDFVEETAFVQDAFAFQSFAESATDSRADSQSLENGRETERDRKKRAKNVQAPANNIGPVKYQKTPNWGGFDGGCEASFWGKWDPELFPALCQRLDLAKQAANDHNEAASYIEFGGFVWRVRETGAAVAFCKYKFVMESHGVKLYVHSNPQKQIPAFHVRFGFECLVRTNLFEAVNTLKECFLREGFTLKRETISRVDMQVLLPVHISEFSKAMEGERILTRCRGDLETHTSMSSRRIQTISLKSQNCELCIYDKRAELMKSDPVYFETFCKYVLGGEFAEIPKQMTRVEFRFRRAYLRRYGVNDFDELKSSASALLEIVSRDWFRILERDKVRGSENEIADAEIWAQTREAFDYYFGEKRPENRSTDDLKNYKPPQEPPKVQRLVKQALGCLASAGAVCLEKAIETKQVIQFCVDRIEAGADDILDKICQIQVFNQVVRGFTNSPSPDYSTLNEVQEGLAPIGFPEFWGLEGAGWEIG